jgi:putative NADH-flavin reductase
MRLAVFGASGRTGAEILRQAEARGWPVRALIRPDTWFPARRGLELVRGELNPTEVGETLREAEAVVCVLGPRSTRAAPYLADATHLIVDIMRAAGLKRFLCQTGAMVGELPPNVSLAMAAITKLLRSGRPDLAEDTARQERVVIESPLHWTLVKPPRLTNGPSKGRVRVGTALNVGLLSRVSRVDLARFLLDEAAAGLHVRERVYVRA